MRAYARCKFPDCSKFFFFVENKPTEDDRDVTVRVRKSTRGGSSNHDGIARRRRLTGKRRREIGSLSRAKGAILTRQELLEHTPDNDLKDGNASGVPTLDVLRHAAAEARFSDRFSKNPNVDIDIIMKTTRAADVTSEKVLGYVHTNSIEPFKVHIFTEELLRYFSKNTSAIHMDATGSVVNKVNGKDVYCYAIVASDDEGSYPLGLMLSNSQTTVSITHFIQHLNDSYKTITRKDMRPTAVVTDISWAMIKAGLLALNKMDISQYLESCWQATVKAESPSMITFSMCRAHIAKGWSCMLKSHIADKKVRQAYMWLFSKMAESDSLDAMEEMFKEICILAYSLSVDANKMEKLMRQYDQEEEELDEREVIIKRKKTLRDSTPFGKHFASIAAKLHEQAPDDQVTSPFYSPSMIKHLLTTYMPMAPFWSRLLPSSAKLLSNASVESYFKTLKHGLLRGATKLHAGDFVRVIIRSMSARQKINLLRPQERPHLKKRQGQKRRTADEEKWQRRKRRKNTYSQQVDEPQALKVVRASISEGKTHGRMTIPEDTKDTTAKKNIVSEEHKGRKSWSIGNVALNLEDLKSTHPNQWLNDSIIDGFLLSVACGSARKVSVFSCHALVNMRRWPLSRELSAALARSDLQNVWLVPLNRGTHWSLFVVNRAEKSILYVDTFLVREVTLQE